MRTTNQPQYNSYLELLSKINEPNREASKRLYLDHKVLFETGKGSTCKHQYWRGGYLDHMTEIMNIARGYYEFLNSCRPLSFSLSDALLTLNLHDIEKPWKYAEDESVRIKFRDEEHKHEFRRELIQRYGFELTDEHFNALKYVHGEGDDWDPHIIKQGPLGAFIHHCDNTSARIWQEYPLTENDPWKGASRQLKG